MPKNKTVFGDWCWIKVVKNLSQVQEKGSVGVKRDTPEKIREIELMIPKEKENSIGVALKGSCHLNSRVFVPGR